MTSLCSRSKLQRVQPISREYAAQWARFAAWAEARGLPPRPAVPAARGARRCRPGRPRLLRGLRRSEITALRWQDVTETAQAGQLRVRVRQSKTNPDGARADDRLLVQSFAAALTALRDATAPAPPARVIPLSPSQVNRRLQALAGVSSYSGRRGLASELIRRGAWCGGCGGRGASATTKSRGVRSSRRWAPTMSSSAVRYQALDRDSSRALETNTYAGRQRRSITSKLAGDVDAKVAPNHGGSCCSV